VDPLELLAYVAAVFERLGIEYLVTGSVASTLYGEPRLTNDIDVVAGIESQHIKPLCAAFAPAEYSVDPDAIEEAIVRGLQFNIIQPATGLKIDVIVRQPTAFDESRFARKRRQELGSFAAVFASPEDVIIKKMDYYRLGGSDKHLRDIAGILKIAGEAIDREYVERWAEKFGVPEVWRAIVERVKEHKP